MSSFSSPSKVSRKPVWGAILLLLVFGALTIISFGYSYSQAALDKNRITLISDLTLLSQQLGTTTLTTVKTNTGSFDTLEKQRNEFKEKLHLLQSLEKNNSFTVASGSLDSLRLKWQSYNEQLEHIIRFKSAITNTHAFAQTVYVTLPGLRNVAEQVVLRMEKEGSDAKQLHLAIHQLILLHKLENNLLLMLEGRNDVKNIIESFAKNTTKFDERLKWLLTGNRYKNFIAVENSKVRFYLLEIERNFNGLSEEISALLDNATVMQTVYDSVEKSIGLGEILFVESRDLKNKVGDREELIQQVSMAAYAFGLLALLSLMGLMYALFYAHRERLRLTEEENVKIKKEVKHLTNRMMLLADGDLKDDFEADDIVYRGSTGAIAVALDNTIKKLRVLLRGINGSSKQVKNNADKAEKTAGYLSTASKKQSNEVTAASAAIHAITENVQRVANYAVNSVHVAKKSLGISRQGATTVRETLEGMHAIREQVQVTAKRIKRLSESSQEVSHISQLMNDIAEQTQVLALNASIQMSSAGDAGKGFGGVAEEVQLLAKKAATTSRKAEVLVKTMQVDTQKTVTSMEETITHVVEGTKSAENAGKALEEVETESIRIAKLMMNIAKINKDQLNLSTRSKNRMHSIEKINLQTSERVSETTDLISSLTSTAAELQDSVELFELPEVVNKVIKPAKKSNEYSDEVDMLSVLLVDDSFKEFEVENNEESSQIMTTDINEKKELVTM